MKNLKLFAILSLILVLNSCGDNKSKQKKDSAKTDLNPTTEEQSHQQTFLPEGQKFVGIKVNEEITLDQYEYISDDENRYDNTIYFVYRDGQKLGVYEHAYYMATQDLKPGESYCSLGIHHATKETYFEGHDLHVVYKSSTIPTTDVLSDTSSLFFSGTSDEFVASINLTLEPSTENGILQYKGIPTIHDEDYVIKVSTLNCYWGASSEQPLFLTDIISNAFDAKIELVTEEEN